MTNPSSFEIFLNYFPATRGDLALWEAYVPGGGEAAGSTALQALTNLRRKLAPGSYVIVPANSIAKNGPLNRPLKVNPPVAEAVAWFRANTVSLAKIPARLIGGRSGTALNFYRSEWKAARGDRAQQVRVWRWAQDALADYLTNGTRGARVG